MLKIACCVSILAVTGCATASMPAPQTTVPPVKIMAINLCQHMSEPRSQRFARLADYLVQHKIDMVLYQEGSGGLADFTRNSVNDLCKLLRDRGATYHYRDANSFGIPGVCLFKTGVLTNSKIDWAETGVTGQPAGSLIDWFPVSGRANIVAVGIGDTAYVSTHFFSGAPKFAQAVKLVKYVDDLVARRNVKSVVLGGDFNMARSATGHAAILDAGFQELAGAGVDFIFGRGVSGAGEVVIPAGDISDHPAVVAEIKKD